jgi:hypothetical protein
MAEEAAHSAMNTFSLTVAARKNNRIPIAVALGSLPLVRF